SRERIRGRVRHCAGELRWPPATLCWCRMPTWNMTRGIMRNCWSRFWTGGRGVWFAVPGRAAARALLLALLGEQIPDAAFRPLHEPKAVGHGDLLQGVPVRGAEGNTGEVRPVRI